MKNKLTVSVAFLVGLVLGVGGAQLIHPGTAAESCNSRPAHGQSHSIMIMNDKVEPAQTTGQLCDTLTITNMDDITREIAFGMHQKHVFYDGIEERSLKKDESFTITMNQTGTFHFHDHLHDETEGYFTVTK